MSKSEKSKILDFLTNCHTYMGNRLSHKKFNKTKNAGRRNFCSSAERCARRGKKLSKIKALPTRNFGALGKPFELQMSIFSVLF